MHPLILVNDVARHIGHRTAVGLVENRHRCDPVDSRADRVELDLERLDRFRRGVRRNFAGVIFAVGQEDDGATFRFLVRQTIRRRRHGRADRGSVFDQADPHSLEILQKPIVIERQRTHHIRPPGEGDDPDAVVRPGFDELSRHFADGVNPRRRIAADREILGQHRAGNVEHDHDVDPARFDLGQALAELRPGECENQNGEREIKQAVHDPARA